MVIETALSIDGEDAPAGEAAEAAGGADRDPRDAGPGADRRPHWTIIHGLGAGAPKPTTIVQRVIS